MVVCQQSDYFFQPVRGIFLEGWHLKAVVYLRTCFTGIYVYYSVFWQRSVIWVIFTIIIGYSKTLTITSFTGNWWNKLFRNFALLPGHAQPKRQKLYNNPFRLTTKHFSSMVPSNSSKKNASRKYFMGSMKKIHRAFSYHWMEFKVAYIFNYVSWYISQKLNTNSYILLQMRNLNFVTFYLYFIVTITII